ncbi:hypothetical protein P4909_24895 [Escherichia coli]
MRANGANGVIQYRYKMNCFFLPDYQCLFITITPD